MYISLNGTLVAGGQLSWTEFAELAARVGYAAVDVNLGAAMRDGVEATRSLLARLKLRPGIVGLPVDFRQDEAVFQQGLAKLDEAARFACAIGCPRMATWVMSSSERPKAEQRRILKERIQACAEILHRHGVRLGLEFLGPLHLRRRFPHEFIYRMDEMLDFARECGPNLGLLLDSWHWHLAGATVADILRAGKDGIVHVHVSDVPAGLPPEKILDSERLMPGEGAVDWVGFFGALRKIGYRDAVSPEVFGRGLKTMRPEDGARLGLSYTLDVMRKAGVV
jgi:sugar phosphate isomerase/epimerase